MSPTDRHTGSDLIHHLADPQEWAAARAAGVYERSTRGRSLAEEGFIHCSSAAQWPLVRRAFYGDVTTPLVLLTIDPRLVTAPVLHEVGNPETGETFPHIHGPLNLDAVVGTAVIPPPHG